VRVALAVRQFGACASAAAAVTGLPRRRTPCATGAPAAGGVRVALAVRQLGACASAAAAVARRLRRRTPCATGARAV